MESPDVKTQPANAIPSAMAHVLPQSDPSHSPALLLVSHAEHGLRLDAFLSAHSDYSRTRIKKFIDDGFCQVNSNVCTAPAFRLSQNDSVLFFPPESATCTLIPEQGDLVVLYQDKDLVVVNKPAALTVHPCPSCPKGTLVHLLLAHFPELAAQEGPRPGIVHRLDKDTSGLLLVALTETARLALTEAFAMRRVHKSYLALTHGVPPAQGRVDLPLGRHPFLKTRMAVVPQSKGGREALSEWTTLYADPDGRFALLAVTIHTGRTHQIRVHLAESGYPLWGDTVYGPSAPLPIKGKASPEQENTPIARQMLHAWRLKLTHPVSKLPLSFTCPPPDDMLKAALSLSAKTQRVVLSGVPGCGKSSLLRLLEKHGVPTWSADEAVRNLYAPGATGWTLLLQRYGDRFFTSSVSLGFQKRRAGAPSALPEVDREALGQAFTEEANLRAEVETLIHPLVYEALNTFWQQHANAPLAVAEVPLWHESNTAKKPENRDIVTVCVVCPEKARLLRLQQNRGWSPEKIAQMDDWQWSQEAKTRASCLAVDNSGDQSALEKRAAQLMDHLQRMRDEKQMALKKTLLTLLANHP